MCLWHKRAWINPLHAHIEKFQNSKASQALCQNCVPASHVNIQGLDECAPMLLLIHLCIYLCVYLILWNCYLFLTMQNWQNTCYHGITDKYIKGRIYTATYFIVCHSPPADPMHSTIPQRGNTWFQKQENIAYKCLILKLARDNNM